ncbi:GNAT family N-acetyltransferase [Arthrobacter terrae]|uniref:GNAT family N-acetyltransferase n=1 Tax=Arthrobacter terrae TaxID=2935737 RepID=UPI001E525E5A|nr:GNAT family N-acetyltransferase [Arthrobacter terrae]
MSHASPDAPRKLLRTDNRDAFAWGAAELDEWLRRYAFQNQRANSAVTYVACDGKSVVGYYAIAVGAVAKQGAPPAITKGGPSDIPCILLARLAVDKRYQGTGLGAGLLQDALKRAVLVRESIGGNGCAYPCSRCRHLVISRPLRGRTSFPVG